MKKIIHNFSEIGKLKTVLLHRPGQELEQLTPDYLEKTLFDDIPYLKVAQEEHDAFAKILQDYGVEVLYLDQLVAESLYLEEVKQQFIREMIQASKQDDRSSTEAIINYLNSMPTLDMIRKIISGVKKTDVIPFEPASKQLHHYMIGAYPFYLDPIPNLYFTRDPATAIGNGLTLYKMYWPARNRESLFMAYIVKHHPRFSKDHLPIWYDRKSPFSLEGGDVLVLNKQTLAIGISERTEVAAIEKITSTLFTQSNFKKILAIKIPSKRAFMHLDTVLTMVDYDKFTLHPGILDSYGHLNSYILTKEPNEIGYQVTPMNDLQKALEQTLDLPKVTLIKCGKGDPWVAHREQWNDGANTLALAPGVVITYDRNYVTNDALRNAGIKVIEIAGSELGRGRGGPHCMSMSLAREDL